MALSTVKEREAFDHAGAFCEWEHYGLVAEAGYTAQISKLGLPARKNPRG